MADSRNKPSIELVERAISSCFSRNIRKRESVVVGFSGGLDSTVLLHASAGVAKVADIDLSALHVHHGLSSHADMWQDACVRMCGSLTIPLSVASVEVPKGSGKGLEAAARSMRHKSLADYPADWVLLGHHADDQAETVLHNLLRGAGVRGAAAMPQKRGRILRPLLSLGREALVAYAQAHNLEWIEDESNTNIRFTRNFLRSKIMPVVVSRFPRAREQLAAAALRFSEAEALLNDLAILDLLSSKPEFPLPLKLFRDLSEARARNLLRAMLGWHCVQPPDERRLKEFVRQLQTAGADRHPRLEFEHYILWSERGNLCFTRP